jgi:hypothetical protein
MEPKHRKDLVPYIYCLVHHLVVVPYAIHHIYLEAMRSDDESFATNHADVFKNAFPYSFGYLFGDLIMYAIPEAISGKSEYLLHHILGLGLTVGSAVAKGPMVRMAANMLVVELTGIFLSFSWLLKHLGWRDFFIVKILDILFAAFFFLLRIIHLSALVWGFRVEILKYPIVAFIFVPVLGMQFYWFSKILVHFVSSDAPKKEKKTSDDKKKN